MIAERFLRALSVSVGAASETYPAVLGIECRAFVLVSFLHSQGFTREGRCS
jgi:hypothetical protein